jgi:hypothetical protein
MTVPEIWYRMPFPRVASPREAAMQRPPAATRHPLLRAVVACHRFPNDGRDETRLVPAAATTGARNSGLLGVRPHRDARA